MHAGHESANDVLNQKQRELIGFSLSHRLRGVSRIVNQGIYMELIEADALPLQTRRGLSVSAWSSKYHLSKTIIKVMCVFLLINYS